MSIEVFPVISLAELGSTTAAVDHALGALAVGADGIFLRDSIDVQPGALFSVYRAVRRYHEAARIGLQFGRESRAIPALRATLNALKADQQTSAPYALWYNPLPSDISHPEAQELVSQLPETMRYGGLATYYALPASHKPENAAQTVRDFMEHTDVVVTTGSSAAALPYREKITAMHDVTSGAKPLAIAGPIHVDTLLSLQKCGTYPFEQVLVTPPVSFDRAQLAHIIEAAHAVPTAD